MSDMPLRSYVKVRATPQVVGELLMEGVRATGNGLINTLGRLPTKPPLEFEIETDEVNGQKVVEIKVIFQKRKWRAEAPRDTKKNPSCA